MQFCAFAKAGFDIHFGAFFPGTGSGAMAHEAFPEEEIATGAIRFIFFFVSFFFCFLY